MRTVVLGEPPPVVADWLERRRALGQDLFDEVWEGEYHVAPMAHARHGDLDDQVAAVLRPLARAAGLWPSSPVNLGRADDYRVPDRVYLRERGDGLYVSSAAIVVEIVSPGDESFAKLGFYAARGVDEALLVDPAVGTCRWYARSGGEMVPVEGSRLLGLTAVDLEAQLDWPPAG